MFATIRQVRVAGVLAGYLADLALSDPKRGHPVALFGQVADQHAGDPGPPCRRKHPRSVSHVVYSIT